MSAKTSSSPDPRAAARRRNTVIAAVCGLVFSGMVGAAFAAVPLYKAFCQLTGYEGTVRRAQAAPDKALDKTLVVRFDTNLRDLPWTFQAEQLSQTVKIGATGLAYFKVTNNSDHPITGHAVYNVLPGAAGAYFQKLECFCFSDQTIPAGKTVEFPVVYFVDPKYATDINTRNTGEVTLSYTFYPAVPSKAAAVTAEAQPGKPASALGGTARAGL
jgi:cytochrome c oxidase assembly protein subunit 11